MRTRFKKDRLLLLLGDILCFYIALVAALLLRAGRAVDGELILAHLAPFSLLFVVWLGVFFIFDLYRPQTTIFKQKLPGVIFKAQLINSVIAFLFFYLIPYFGITPKTILFIDLIVSFVFVWAWRRHLATIITFRRRRQVFFACDGADVLELQNEIKHNKSYRLDILAEVPDVKQAGHTVVVFNQYDATGQKHHELYPLLLSGATFVSVFDLYEEIFSRVPLSLINEEWCLENISAHPKPVYDSLKRVMDIILAGLAGLVSLIFYPFVWLAIKLEDGGSLFITQQRVGRLGELSSVYKFRSMSQNIVDITANQQGNKVTKVGNFMRRTRIDELPQLWAVIGGGLSLIGPRPELPSGVGHYEKEIPFYGLRRIIKPGLSGWAQMYHDSHPHHGVDITETRNKLSYDLYYIKNRSFMLDLSIALKTIKTLLSIAGR